MLKKNSWWILKSLYLSHSFHRVRIKNGPGFLPRPIFILQVKVHTKELENLFLGTLNYR